MRYITDSPARMKEMMSFVGLSEADRQLIKASAPIILEHAGSLNDFVYHHLLEYPEARKFFVTDNGEPDEKRIEMNKQTMISWLRGTASAPSNEGFARYLVGIALMHKNIPTHRPHLSPVPYRYIIGTISYYQTAIADLLHQHMADYELASRTSIAWNKLLMVELDLLLTSYLNDH